MEAADFLQVVIPIFQNNFTWQKTVILTSKSIVGRHIVKGEYLV
jgi:hypothetical protein